MNDTIRGAWFCLICGVLLYLVLALIAWHNNRVPWPEMDNPKTQEVPDGGQR